MAEKITQSVWDAYNELYNRGMKVKGKDKFRNWADNILHPEKTRFSLGHLWHGKSGPHHVGGDNTLYSFKRLFGVKEGSSLTDNKLIEDIMSKGSKLHDYTKYNKNNPNEWLDSESNLMSIYEHEGKKYAHFAGKGEREGQNFLYELTGTNEDFSKTVENIKKEDSLKEAEKEKNKKKEKNLKAGVAIAESVADSLKRAWERSYRG